MGGSKSAYQRTDDLLNRMLAREYGSTLSSPPSNGTQTPSENQEQTPTDPYQWDLYRQRMREFEEQELDRDFAAQSEQQMRIALRAESSVQ